jgi:hypothetical protein
MNIMALNNSYKINVRENYLELIESAAASGLEKKELLQIIDEYVKILQDELKKFSLAEEKEEMTKQLVKAYILKLDQFGSFYENKETYDRVLKLIFENLSTKDSNNHPSRLGFKYFCLRSYFNIISKRLDLSFFGIKDNELQILVKDFFKILRTAKDVIYNPPKPDLIIDFFCSMNSVFERSGTTLKKDFIRFYVSFHKDIVLDHVILQHKHIKLLKLNIWNLYVNIIKFLTEENLAINNRNNFAKKIKSDRGAKDDDLREDIEWFNNKLNEIFEDKSGQKSPGFHEIMIKNVRLMSKEGKEKNYFSPKESIVISFDFISAKHIENPLFGVSITDTIGNELFCSDTKKMKISKIERKGDLSLEINPLPLKNGVYFVSVFAFNQRADYPYDFSRNAVMFNIVSEEKDTNGILSIPSKWSFNKTN